MQAKDITFGVEIECKVPQRHIRAGGRLMRGRYHHGIQIDNAPAGWRSEADGSLRDVAGGYVGAEIVSPVLAGEDGLAQVVYMLDELDAMGARIDGDCGLHVHVSAAAVSHLTDARIRREWCRWERVFFALNGRHAAERWGSHYCAPVETGGGGRYCALNLTNRGNGYKHTIEFRLFRATLRPERVFAAVLMCVGFVAALSELGRVPDVPANATTMADAMRSWWTFMANIEKVAMVVPGADCADVFAEAIASADEAAAAWQAAAVA